MHPRSWLDPQSYHPGQEKQNTEHSDSYWKYALDAKLLNIKYIVKNTKACKILITDQKKDVRV
jgi:hypothetical protein